MIRTLYWFEGIGGFRYGLEKANCGPYSGQDREEDNLPPQGYGGSNQGANGEPAGFRCVGACEIDRYARSVYAHNFGHEPEWADSLTVDVQSLPDHDLFTAGFPCQDFSVAGKRRGFEGTRGTLFFEICRVLGAKRPRLLLLENVKGLLSHDQGDTFQTIIESLDELGYDLQWQVLNSKNFGVPQNRERVFIIGHLRGTPRPQVFPLGKDVGQGAETDRLGVVQTEDIAGCVQEGTGRRLGLDGSITFVAMTAYTKGNRTDSRVQETDTYPCLDGSQAYAVAPTIRAEHHNTADVHFIPEKANAVDHTGFLLDTHHKAEQSMSSRLLRRLTPKECERLQGFPDDWTRWGLKDGQPVEISDTQRYKMCGNAVTTNVITAIGERILQEIQESL
ncbi:hypothetical protein LCGC14_0480980 [marine sediment metagenome]|uniref:DNA (cytosine-5-)-methyltransferase n=1 Tax=marine sediment metagenome TaxID=412755 RepID=A0A0F9SEM6_9ZZZZ